MYATAIHLPSGWIIHLDGTPWYLLPIPRRWHTCYVATAARLGILIPESYHRCACGGWQVRHFGADDYTPWRERNSRRKGYAHSFTTF